MKLGISSYSLTWSVGVPGYEDPASPLTAIDILRIAGQNQIRLVQFADNLPLHLMTEEELAELSSVAQALSIELEVGTRGTDPDHLLLYLELAKRLDAKLVRTLITETDLELPTWQLRQVLHRYQDEGIRIAVENHGLHTTKQLAAMFDEIDHPFLGCCMDTVNSFSALDSPDRVAEDLVPYISNLHIKDFDITRVDHQMGFMVLGKPAGYGKLNIPLLLERIRAENKNPTAILELWTPYTDSMEQTVKLERKWFDESLLYLRTLPWLE